MTTAAIGSFQGGDQSVNPVFRFSLEFPENTKTLKKMSGNHRNSSWFSPIFYFRSIHCIPFSASKNRPGTLYPPQKPHLQPHQQTAKTDVNESALRRKFIWRQIFLATRSRKEATRFDVAHTHTHSPTQPRTQADITITATHTQTYTHLRTHQPTHTHTLGTWESVTSKYDA